MYILLYIYVYIYIHILQFPAYGQCVLVCLGLNHVIKEPFYQTLSLQTNPYTLQLNDRYGRWACLYRRGWYE